eukprot:6213746-Pleurochrysis_carterae.AAC.1
MGVEDLRDQLKKHTLLGKTGFTLSLPNRTAYVLQLQTLLLEANEDANDLKDGDSGIDSRSLRRRATVRGRMRRRGLRSYMGCEWTEKKEEEVFEVEAGLWPTGRRPTPTRAASLQVSSSTASCGRDTHQTWCGMSQSLAADAAVDEASARKDAELIDLEESERMPAAICERSSARYVITPLASSSHQNPCLKSVFNYNSDRPTQVALGFSARLSSAAVRDRAQRALAVPCAARAPNLNPSRAAAWRELKQDSTLVTIYTSYLHSAVPVE